MKMKLLLGWFSAVTVHASRCNASWKVEECSAFASTLHNPGHTSVTILNASYVPENTFNASGVFNSIPACRVFGSVPYAGQNSVVFELWLPAADTYNDRFLVEGNGGLAGTISTKNVVTSLNKGYAVAGGNGGHFAAVNYGGTGAPDIYLPFMHDQDQVSAWIHDSVAYFTPAARDIAARFYHKMPKRSYYEGCSTGGAQGFALAQFYPNLFDGIVAGCPGNWYSHLGLSFLWNDQMTQGSNSLPRSALDLITKAVLTVCDHVDGLLDGVIENPLSCVFEVASLECKSSEVANSSACLTPAQVSAAQRLYDGPVDSRSGGSLYPGFSLGSESEWIAQEGPPAQAASVAIPANVYSIPLLQNIVFDNISYDASEFNWGTDVDLLDEIAGTFIDQVSPDLSRLKAKGGKMIVYQSWADPLNAATWPIQHLHEIEDFFGGDVSDWYRLFMIPGGGHCGSAMSYPHVPGTWHALDSLVHWVEKGEAPTEILGTDPFDKTLKEKTSKLCPWPQTAKFRGGDPNDWSSFECEK
ncbi:feruloyl esterase [Hypoxylon sp. NC1633]|nr:feruloyl esterase [Hypoxylon sp. NC1633]